MRKQEKPQKSIYLDYASTTPVDPDVLAAMGPYFSKQYANPSSLHTMGRSAHEAVEQARKEVTECLNCSEEEIVFTSGGTESDNIAILGLASVLAEKGINGTIICSEIEHHAIIDSVKATEKFGFKTKLLLVDKNGIVDLKALEEMLKKGDVKLVSIMYANNEIGTIQPVAKAGALCKKHGAVFHTDACQATPYLNLDVAELNVDMLTLNGSKMYGPKGVGLLYVRKGVELAPVIFGGGQERGLRSGTENVPGIVGLAKALSLAQKIRHEESKREEALRNQLIDELLSIPKTVLNGDRGYRLPNNANISFLGVEGEALLLELDRAGIFVSTGSACSSKSLEPSHVIMAIHKADTEPHAYAHSSIRFTLGKYTTAENIDYTVKAVKTAVEKLRSISSAW